MNLFMYAISILCIVFAQGAENKPSCIPEKCSQTVSHFYFSNFEPERKLYHFSSINTIDTKAQPYIQQLATMMKKQAEKILDQEKGWIDSIKDKFTTQTRKKEILENSLVTFNNTYLVINELLAIEGEDRKPLDGIKTIFHNINNINTITSRLFSEILQLIEKRTLLTQKWRREFKSKDIFFGFSLTKTIDQTWSMYAKNLLANRTSYITKTVPQNRLSYMISIFETIFTKINTLIYWKHVSKKANIEQIDTEMFKTIHKVLGTLRKNLADYSEDISSKVVRTKTLDANLQLQGAVEVAIVSNVTKWIDNNLNIIDKLIPKTLPKGASPQQQLCECPYLQIDINFDIPNLSTLYDAKQQKKIVFDYLVSLANEIIAINVENKRPLHSNLTEQFFQLVVLYYQIWQSELQSELTSGGSPIPTGHKNVQEALTIVKEQQLKKFLYQCDRISTNIKKRWMPQASKTPESSTNRAMKWTKKTISSLFFSNYYFFGFSLLTSSSKNSDFNRYTYMIKQLENIFETINALLPWYTQESIIYIICKEKQASCSNIKEIINPLETLIATLATYQNHFFDKLIDYAPDRINNKHKIPSELARKDNPHGLQVGVEYAIVDRVIAWIEQNIAIINRQETLMKKPENLPVVKEEIKNLPKKSKVPPKVAKKDEKYFDPEGDWELPEKIEAGPIEEANKKNSAPQ